MLLSHKHTAKEVQSSHPVHWSFPVLTRYYLYSQIYLRPALSKCCSSRFPTTLSSFSSFLFQWFHSVGKRYLELSHKVSPEWHFVSEQIWCRISLKIKTWCLVFFKTDTSFVTHKLHKLIENNLSVHLHITTEHCSLFYFETPIGVYKRWLQFVSNNSYIFLLSKQSGGFS